MEHNSVVSDLLSVHDNLPHWARASGAQVFSNVYLYKNFVYAKGNVDRLSVARVGLQ